MGILFPVFVLVKDSGDVERFDSIDQMQRQLEEIDIENHEYDAWDSAGVPLRLQVQEPVWLAISPLGDRAQEDLRAALLSYAKRLGVDVGETEGVDVSELFARIRPGSSPQRK
jgi:hypothetical protein